MGRMRAGRGGVCGDGRVRRGQDAAYWKLFLVLGLCFLLHFLLVDGRPFN